MIDMHCTAGRFFLFLSFFWVFGFLVYLLFSVLGCVAGYPPPARAGCVIDSSFGSRLGMAGSLSILSVLVSSFCSCSLYWCAILDQMRVHQEGRPFASRPLELVARV